MPIVNQSHPASQTASPVAHADLWPKLNESNTKNANNKVEETKTVSDDEDWEYVSSNSSTRTDSDDDAQTNNSSSKGTSTISIIHSANASIATLSSEAKEELEDTDNDHSIMHRCDSTPAFSSYSSLGSFAASDDELSFVVDCESSVDAHSIMTTNDDTVLLSHKTGTGTGTGAATNTTPIKKVPSFKDIMMLNAQQKENEDMKKKAQLKELAEKRRLEAVQRRKTTKTRIIVTPIKRCAKSTGDLRSLVIHEEEEGYGGGGGGGGGIIHEEEVLGESDAMEYYNRKSHGSKGRANGRKQRPDEAKRKEFIIHKKNAQRRAQGVKEKHKD